MTDRLTSESICKSYGVQGRGGVAEPGFFRIDSKSL